MCVDVYVHARACVFGCVYVKTRRMCMYVCVCVRMRACVCICRCVCVRVCGCVCATYTCKPTYSNKHTYRHTCILTHTNQGCQGSIRADAACRVPWRTRIRPSSLLLYACMLGFRPHSGDHGTQSCEVVTRERLCCTDAFYFCGFRNLWGCQTPCRSTDTI